MLDWKKLNRDLKEGKKSYYIIISGDKEFCKDNFYTYVLGEQIETISSTEVVDRIAHKYLDNVLQNYETLTVVTGDNKGADGLAMDWAIRNDKDVMYYEADWDVDGKKAGFLRNDKMFSYVGVRKYRGALLFWDGINPMTRHLVWLAYQYSIPLRVYNYKKYRMLKKFEIEEIQKEEEQKQLSYYS